MLELSEAIYLGLTYEVIIFSVIVTSQLTNK